MIINLENLEEGFYLNILRRNNKRKGESPKVVFLTYGGIKRKERIICFVIIYLKNLLIT